MSYYPLFGFYTDKFESFRVQKTVVNGIVKQERVKVLDGIPCRAYQNGTNSPNLNDTAATVSYSNTLCCELGNDVQGGDEIIVYRGANVGKNINPPERYIAGPANIYVEPIGNGFPNLDHMQIALIDEKVIG